MGVITVKHYRASKLPEELRAGLPDDALVSVTVEEEQATTPLGREELLKLMREAQASARGTTVEEAVARIRKLRDEWD